MRRSQGRCCSRSRAPRRRPAARRLREYRPTQTQTGRLPRPQSPHPQPPPSLPPLETTATSAHVTRTSPRPPPPRRATTPTGEKGEGRCHRGKPGGRGCHASDGPRGPPLPRPRLPPQPWSQATDVPRRCGSAWQCCHRLCETAPPRPPQPPPLVLRPHAALASGGGEERADGGCEQPSRSC